jgi:signal transduction histidine kinase
MMKSDKTFLGHIREVLSSIRSRVFVISLLLGLCPCIILQYGILSSYEKRAVDVKAQEVQLQLRALANHLITADFLGTPGSKVIRTELNEFSSLYNGRLLVVDSSLQVISDTYSIATGKTAISEDIVYCLKNGTSMSPYTYDPEANYITLVTPIVETASLETGDMTGIRESEPPSPQGVLKASVSTKTIETTLDMLSRTALLFEMVITVSIFLLALFFAYYLVSPLERLSKSIAAVKAGFTTNLVSAPEYLETRHIADAFNEVLARMNQLDASRQEFVSNVSHELKTPMTSAKVLADSLLMQEHVEEEVYREFLQDIDNEIDRENKIISELLTLVRMDNKETQLNIQPININDMLEMILKRVRPQARERDIELLLVSERKIVAEVDETRMTMALTNLIENAVKYNKEHGKVRVRTDADHQSFTIEIMDTGVGIPPESINRVFERFYRVDKSRSREMGGTGLGLSISRSVVLQHHGSISVESKEGEGTTFYVIIPLSYIPEPVEMVPPRSERKR